MAALLEARERVAAGTLTARSYHNLEMVLGFNPNRFGLLADREFAEHTDVMRAITWDWVHNSFQDGTFTTEARPRSESFPHIVPVCLVQLLP